MTVRSNIIYVSLIATDLSFGSRFDERNELRFEQVFDALISSLFIEAI